MMLTSVRDIDDRIDELKESIQNLLNQAEQEERDLDEAESQAVEEMLEELGQPDPATGLYARRDKRAKIEAVLSHKPASAPTPKRVVTNVLDRRLTISPVAASRRLYFKGTRNGADAEERTYRFGRWCAFQLARQIPHRYAGQFKESVEFVKKNILNVGDTSTHSALVPEEFTADLIDLRERFGVARRTMRIRPMSEATRNDPRQIGRLTAYWTAESAPLTESEQQYDNVPLHAEKLTALSRITAELNQDSIIDIGNQLARDIAWAFAYEEDQAGFFGDGNPGSGGITGLVTALATLSPGVAPGLIAVPGTAWTDITIDHVLAVVGNLPEYADTEGEVGWICSKVFFYTVLRKLVLAQMGSTGVEMENAQRPLLLGYPVDFSQVFPKAAATSQIPVIFGNLNLSSSFGDRMAPEVMFSEHATIGGENVFERNQIAVRGIERLDINNHDFGSDTEAGPVTAMQLAAA